MIAAPPSPIPLPRPNLGPEPWPPWWSRHATAIWTALALTWLALAAWAAYRARRRWKPRRPTPSSAESEAQPGSIPAEPLEEWSRSVRELLAHRFGPSWLGRTTEELAESPELRAMLGPELFQELLEGLRTADRARFDPAPPGPDELRVDPRWEELLILLEEWVRKGQTGPEDA